MKKQTRSKITNFSTPSVDGRFHFTIGPKDTRIDEEFICLAPDGTYKVSRKDIEKALGIRPSGAKGVK